MPPKLSLTSDNGKTVSVEAIGIAQKEAVLCALNTRCWGNSSKKVEQEKLKKLTGKELSKMLNHNKRVVNKKALADINAIITKARNTIKSYALPFPIDSVYLVPKSKVFELATKLDELIENLPIAVDVFADTYQERIMEAREDLGEVLFNEADYPTDIKNHFSISYRFLEMGVPGEFKEVSPDLYNKEMAKFKQMMEEARGECVIYLREAFVKELKGITDALTGQTEDGKAKRIREDTLQKVERFFDIFKTKNIFADTELLKEIESARRVMFGIEASDLKSSEKLKELIVKQIEKVSDTVENSIVKYRRKVSF